jgi:hypothetical protein
MYKSSIEFRKPGLTLISELKLRIYSEASLAANLM